MAHKNKDVVVLVCILVHATFEIVIIIPTGSKSSSTAHQ